MSSDLKIETWYFIEAFIEHNHETHVQTLPLHGEVRSRIEQLVESGITEFVIKDFEVSKRPKRSRKVKVCNKQSGIENIVDLDENPLNKMVVLNNEEESNYVQRLDNDHEIFNQEQEKQCSSNYLVLLRQKLKNLLKITNNLEEGQYLQPIVETITSVESILDGFQQKQVNLVVKSKSKKRKGVQLQKSDIISLQDDFEGMSTLNRISV